jgi:two-component system, OmpR family, osmolarity sensor histidine kinase EnvZ
MASPDLKLGLFARTFLLLALLMLASLAAWLHVFWTLEREPRATQIADQLVRAVQLTQATDHFMAPAQRAQWLNAIETHTDFKRLHAEQTQTLTPLPDNADWRAVNAIVTAKLGEHTRLAASSPFNGEVWIHMMDNQWLGVQVHPINQTTGPEWVSWIAAAALLSMMGAAVAVGYLNSPLSRLSRVAQQLSKGQTPDALPETGPQEIQHLNASFNRMVSQLQQAEADRNLMLAGISHDLRTPLARMRLEVEMSPMSDEQRRAIDQDLSQVDQTIGQLLQYAKPANELPASAVNLLDVIQNVIRQTQATLANTQDHLRFSARTQAYCLIDREDFSRCVTNLLENARRYGRSAQGTACIEIAVQSRCDRLHVDVRDRGPGIASHDIDRLLRPFSRGEAARTGGAGCGLGLAIVERLLAHAGGRLRLLPREAGGLIARMDLPRARRPRDKKDRGTIGPRS